MGMMMETSQLGGLRELGPQSSQTGRSTGWPEKPCLTMGSGTQNRGSRFVYIYLHLIYGTGIYRYKWNHSKAAVKPFRPSRWLLLKTPTVK